MPVFVHLAPERVLRSIRRKGIVPPRVRFGRRGVYALPVTHSFYISHQWLRELRRWGGGTIAGVYFRLPDDEPVEVGHYNRGRVLMTAAEAAGLLFEAEARDPARARAEDAASKAVQRGRVLPTSAEGYEVFIPRGIHPSEILRIKALPQVVGWRYRPGANGQPPCACICCERGQYGIRKLLGRVEEAEALDRPAKAVILGREDASFRRVERIRKLRRGE
ncbi:MAG: hypothetical protein AVDCRST_MAG68-1682 [uncultured Gemmatimonadetes bacterium]|uniref:Uncharacterized protein n=1 Tax=uncultured Gemmatimonadota bacterium TaxID=203437 RepID=A0A6J4K3L6_9BACT|nr:MAG: hypothetical protein AVDCRST_MAG68-1682 [uncultured Gemmatimonadota bacterium]